MQDFSEGQTVRKIYSGQYDREINGFILSVIKQNSEFCAIGCVIQRQCIKSVHQVKVIFTFFPSCMLKNSLNKIKYVSNTKLTLDHATVYHEKK